MGQIYKISCNCGYQIKVLLGGGLAACNLNIIKRIFSQEKLQEFNTYLDEKKVKSYIAENELCFCEKCNNIMNIATLKYELDDNTQFKIINDCNKCNNTVKVLTTQSIICPRCGKEMRASRPR